MDHPTASLLLLCYGIFLISCGVVAVAFIGIKAKTALASGGTAGAMAIVLSQLIAHGINAGYWGGLALCFALFCVFSWRSTKTLFALSELIAQRHEEMKVKGIAFLIISLMAVMSMVVLILLITQ